MNDKKRTSGRIAWSASLACAVCIVAGLGLTKYSQIASAKAQAAAYPEPSESATLFTVSTQDVEEQLSVIGEVEAIERVELRIEVPGIARFVGFSSGDIVKKMTCL